VKDYLLHEPAADSDQQNSNNLTPREQEVLTLLADGESNVEIAEKLSISPKTVSRHRENIMQKLNLHSRTELVKYAIRKGIIQP
jgi:two-component system response regulator NreC